MEQQQQGGKMEAPGRSRTITDLSEGQRRRRASHPNTTDPNAQQNSRPDPSSSSAMEPRSRASYPSNCHPAGNVSLDRASLINHRSREEDSLSKSPGSASSGVSGVSDWRVFQTIGSHVEKPRSSCGPFYSTLGPPERGPRSPTSPRSRLSNQRSVRNQLLRARAYRLARERSEVTTDEEMRGDGSRGGEDEWEDGRWAGRYWSRTERRRHMALSRQHRERRGGAEEHMAGCLQGAAASQTVLELSHLKQNRLRNSKLLDDWTTVEELLTHGTRVESDSQLCPSPLLSVTTV